MAAINTAEVLDIHTHFRPSGWVAPHRPAPQPGAAPEKHEDLDGLVAESNELGVQARALSATVEALFGLEVRPDTPTINGVNDYLAEAVRQRSENFLGLATVDAYAGEEGAEQARYAIEVLGLQGIVIDSSRYDRYLSSPEAFPTLQLAAEHAVPVFVHPFSAPQAKHLVEIAGKPGNSIGRGLQNGVSLLSALHGELPEKLPDLHLIFTSLGHAAVLFGADALAEYQQANGVKANIYIDTMRFNAPLIQYYGATLGADRIIVGSDWPGKDVSRAIVDNALNAAGFDATDQELIRIENARRLFSLQAAKVGAAA